MLLLTVILLIVLSLVSYTLYDKDVLAPPTVVCLGFLFSSLCAFYNEKRWELEFSSYTMGIIAAGVTAFIVGGLFAVVLANINRLDRVSLGYSKAPVKEIDIGTIKTIGVIVFELFTIVYLFLELRRLTGNVIWYEIVSSYRIATTRVNPEEITMRISGLCSMCISFSFIFALEYAYIVGNNIAAKAKQRIIFWFPIVLSCMISFMQGYRSDLLRLWIALLVVSFSLKNRDLGWQKNKETRKMVKKMAFSIIGIAVLFVALRGFVGRDDMSKGPFYYLTFYAGSSIAALDVFLKNPLAPSDIWGKETFYHLNQSIGAWFDRPELRYIFYKEFRRSPNGTYLGNIYTALRPPYYDFGFAGMILVMLLMGCFFVFIYCRVRSRCGKSVIDLRLLIYSYIAYTFFMYFYNCYNNFISFGFVRVLIEMLIVRWFLVGWKQREQTEQSAIVNM